MRAPTHPPKRIHPFVSKHYRYAVVGASSNPEKYGNIVFHDLRKGNYAVFPVNPKETKVDGRKCFPTLMAIAPSVDVVVVVVPPAVGLTILDQAKQAGVKKLWFQPGAESEEIRTRARALGLEIRADGACIMVARRVLGI